MYFIYPEFDFNCWAADLLYVAFYLEPLDVSKPENITSINYSQIIVLEGKKKYNFILFIYPPIVWLFCYSIHLSSACFILKLFFLTHNESFIYSQTL